MKSLLTITMAILACALLSSREARADTIPLQGGSSMEGRIVALDAHGLTLDVSPATGGHGMVEVPAQGLDPTWFYDQRDAQLAVGDVAGRLELALWAYENGLFDQSHAQFAKARKIAPDQVELFRDRIMPERREKIAANMLEAVRFDLASGRPVPARSILTELRNEYGNTKAARLADGVAETVEREATVESRVRAREARDAQSLEASRAAAKRRALLQPSVRLIDQGQNLAKAALLADTSSAAIRYYDQAAVEYDEALGHLQLAVDWSPHPKAIAEDVGALKSVAKHGLAHTSAAKAWIYLEHGALPDARAAVAGILAVDPTSTEALTLSHEIAEASQPNGIWWWHWFNRRRGTPAPALLRLTTP